MARGTVRGNGRKSSRKRARGERAEAVPSADPIRVLTDALTPKLQRWIEQGAEEESKLKAAAVVVNLLEFVQPKLARQVVSQDDAAVIAHGVGAELRKQIAQRLLAGVPPSDGE